jgi:predicted nucleic acid-binding protein
MAEREKEVRLVADTNIILSALLKDGSFIAEMMKTSGIQIYFPEYGLAEISAYKSYILSKRERSSAKQNFDYALKFLLESVIVVPDELYSSRIKEAAELMKDIDEKDSAFLALALQLGSPVWSNDKHFAKQKAAKVLSTKDVLQLINDLMHKDD